MAIAGQPAQRDARVLVVDDSLFARSVLTQVIGGFDFVERVHAASSGRSALSRAEDLTLDVITLDVDMPDMTGFDVLRQLRRRSHDIDVVVISAHAPDGGRTAARALELGAAEVVRKPEGMTLGSACEELEALLRPVLARLVQQRRARGAESTRAGPDRPSPCVRQATLPCSARSKRIVAIGASTGGPLAVREILASFPPQLGVPVVAALHMPAGFTTQLAAMLNRAGPLSVVEGSPGARLEPDTVYIAPGGRQMRVVRFSPAGAPRLEVTDEAPVRNCRPSVDVLFRSVAEVYGARSIAAILTGMGADGVEGLGALKRENGTVIAQDEETCVVFGMPRAAIGAGLVDVVSPIGRIAGHIVRCLRG